MSEEELEFTRRFKSGELTVEAGTVLLMEGSNSPQLFTALHGMGVRYKSLPDGRRQVINFVMPGDFIGLQAGVMGEMKHTVEATTAMTLCVFKRSDLWNLFRSFPRRAYDLAWLAALEEHFIADALTSVGRRSAVERVAWSFHRFHSRAEAIGASRNGECRVPFRQQDLADALGLSLVHTNKTIKRLRDRQIASWNDGVLKVLDAGKLLELAQIDDSAPELRPLV
ncbi:Crp/Fnr family transcriptional regulator (plasmid) [Paroceanicella profunda]|uniref:Crp/Fnr family transcriptional regulator n=2 Tax=Paroceanicella profunda TaxID=2579971 RepID=A0A5B8FJK3_9RHOB|nr:Crp/Fnr family transcriptional regulator [Paroceanicella profunda]